MHGLRITGPRSFQNASRSAVQCQGAVKKPACQARQPTIAIETLPAAPARSRGVAAVPAPRQVRSGVATDPAARKHGARAARPRPSQRIVSTFVPSPHEIDVSASGAFDVLVGVAPIRVRRSRAPTASPVVSRGYMT